MSVESLVIICVGLALGSLVKGISGIGLPLVAIPVMAGFMAIDRAVAIMVIPNLVINAYLMWTYREHAVRLGSLPLIAAAGIAGVVLGSWVLSAVPGIWLVGIMALWLGGYLIHRIAGRQFALPDALGRHAPMLVVALAGMAQGAVGTAGPILAPYVHSLKLRHSQFVFAISLLFQVFAVSQLVSYLSLGLIDGSRIAESLLALAPIAVFLPLSVRLARHLREPAFHWVVIGVLTVIEARLIWRILA